MRMTALERRFAHDILDAIYPGGTHPLLPHSIGELGLDEHLDELGDTWPTASYLTLRFAVLFIGFSPLWMRLPIPPHTMAGLSREERENIIERLYQSSYYIRSFVVLLKSVGGIFYAGTPAIRSVIAPGGPVEPQEALVQLRRKEGQNT